ncbi:MAG: hypothetical protein A2901_03995 [Elusimicrobia bacterium RIFCSPLOWO2_01_FULL_54_10]|nr:MAG: hypothetical protein A2901_03995 [Elusimicrobia bacterium RIFCSPLOWO2_01_FULL_54_10]
MTEYPISDLVTILQTAISPVILISGVGLLLLTMTNRLGRTIDRAREITDQTEKASLEVKKQLGAQLDILWRRARLIRLAIIMASGSALSAAMLVITLFLSFLLGMDATHLITGFFCLCLLLLVGSLALFIREVNESLGALRLEMKRFGVD